MRIPEGELGKECVDPLEEPPAFVGTYSLDSNYGRWERILFQISCISQAPWFKSELMDGLPLTTQIRAV